MMSQHEMTRQEIFLHGRTATSEAAPQLLALVLASRLLNFNGTNARADE